MGTIFGERYEILAAAGRGGMGHVYRARHLGLAKDVALKILAAPARGHVHVDDFEVRFAREARAVARLDHAGCVRVLDHGRVDGAQYIAMELLEGETLGSALAAGPFSTARALDIARQLLRALAHAHEQGVIHRDIKPENIMLTRRARGAPPGFPRAKVPRGPNPAVDPMPSISGPERPRVIDRHDSPSAPERAVLIDFGLASLRDELPLTAVGMCLGSPSYLAPERLLGRPHDTRTDLYALGVVLYEMIAGQKPFAGDTPEHTMHLALHRPARPLRAIRRDIPRTLDRVIRQALAKDPDRRFQDAEAMLLALNDVPSDAEIAERAAAAERDECASTMAIARLDLREPTLLSRIWTWLRYGGWRWRHG